MQGLAVGIAGPEVLGRGQQAVRRLTLVRRRSRVPWIYLLYHREGAAAGPGADEPGASGVGGAPDLETRAEPGLTARPASGGGQPSCRRRNAGTSNGEFPSMSAFASDAG